MTDVSKTTILLLPVVALVIITAMLMAWRALEIIAWATAGLWDAASHGIEYLARPKTRPGMVYNRRENRIEIRMRRGAREDV